MDFKLNKSNLNFRVYAAPTLPNTAHENDICIISDVPMKNWLLSTDAPSGAPRTDGDVWIQYSVNGETVNMLKTGAMMIATISAWQYVDGTWTDKPAQSYQGGEWVEQWKGICLFKAGRGSKFPLVTKQHSSNGYSNITNDYIEIGWTYRDSIGVAIKPDEMIQLDDYTVLRMVGKIDANSYNDPIYLAITTSADIYYADSLTTKISTSAIGEFDLSLDISSVTGLYYPAIFNSSQRSYVYDWWLE